MTSKVRATPVEPLPPACIEQQVQSITLYKSLLGLVTDSTLLQGLVARYPHHNNRPCACTHLAGQLARGCHVQLLSQVRHTPARAHLFSQEAHGSALVQQAKLAVGVLLVTWVAVDASVQQGAVKVAHLSPIKRMSVPRYLF